MNLTTSDVDEARNVLGEHFYANSLEVLSPGSWTADFRIAPVGLVTLGDLRFGADVRMEFGELGAYHVDALLAGELAWRQGRGEPRVATPARAAVFQPVGDTVLERWPADCRLLAVKIDRVVLESELARMLGEPIGTPVQLGPELDTARGPGATWLRLARLLAADAAEEQGLLRHPVLGRQLRESLVGGLLMAAPHNYRDALENPRFGPAAPRAVRRAAEAMRADAGRSFTVADLAEIAGVSTRSLQDGFQRYLQTSPTAYLRDLRLSRVHRELQQAHSGEETVTEVAYRCGFAHLGRFAALYRRRYGVPPSETLRS
ncbi:AraC family transcriptional regulator [Actinoplanes nipponensis]|uniref:Transcriptional regulator n=1 Tax=Actinoplanes nipponensis TaxID=135950 RepID=A0A919ML02_9ACTN|nr:AraC family transcriptional regulator [Actinoplanes nipponensis]GIE49026.1 transcriptional regulator [Actinoplanes nipponensis]